MTSGTPAANSCTFSFARNSFHVTNVALARSFLILYGQERERERAEQSRLEQCCHHHCLTTEGEEGGGLCYAAARVMRTYNLRLK